MLIKVNTHLVLLFNDTADYLQILVYSKNIWETLTIPYITNN